MESKEGKESIRILLKSKTLRKRRKGEYLIYLVLYLVEASKNLPYRKQVLIRIREKLSQVTRNNYDLCGTIEKIINISKKFNIDNEIFNSRGVR